MNPFMHEENKLHFTNILYPDHDCTIYKPVFTFLLQSQKLLKLHHFYFLLNFHFSNFPICQLRAAGRQELFLLTSWLHKRHQAY